MQFQALRPIYGDYGHKDAGDVFSVPSDNVTLRRMAQLEAKGMVTRYRAPVARPTYAVYDNKALTAQSTKGKRA